MSKRLLHSGIWLILAIYLLLAVAYSVASPIFEAPDEIHHVYFVKYLAETHTLPVLGNDNAAGEQALYGQEGGQPPLYYAIGAVLISGIHLDSAPIQENPHANRGVPLQPGNKNSLIHGPEEVWPWHGMALAVHLLRFFSILLGAGTVFFVWKIIQGLFPSQKLLALAVAAMVAFLPQFLFISASVNNDNLVIFLSTFILWLILWLFGPDFSQAPARSEALLLGVFLGFVALSKLSGLNLWLIVGFVYAIHVWTQRDAGEILPSILLTGLGAVAIAFPWYWRNWQLYGDPTALKPFLAKVGPRPSPINALSEFQGLRISFLGLFGWFNVPLPDWIYQLWDVFLAISAIGFLQAVWRRRDHLRPLRRYAFLIMLALWLGLLLLSLIRWTSLTAGTQGRLIFPALASLGVLLMLGWRAWLPGRGWWLAIPPIFLLMISIYSVGWIIPNAYRPPQIITSEGIPQDARISPIIFDDHIMLAGVRVQPVKVHPGESLEITLYWQVLDQVPYDASLYIHVLGRNFEDIAQINSYPGWGSAPTSQWRPGETLVDRYRLMIPGSIAVPTRLVVDVGMFDFDTQQNYSSALVTGKAPPLGVATVRAFPARPPVYKISHSTDFQSDGIIRLQGYDLTQTSFRAGDTLPLHLFWRGLASIDEDYQVFVHLIDKNGKWVAGYDKTPLDGWWPTSMWEPGQTFEDAYPLSIPPNLPPGSYELRTGLYRLSDLQRLPLSSNTERVIDNAAVLTNITITP